MTSTRKALGACLLAVALVLAATRGVPAAQSPDPAFDLYLRSDYGMVKLWLNTSTGEFHWEDPVRKLDVRGRGTMAFPNLGPVVFSFAGPLPGYDWVSVSLKIFGTTATGVMAVFPEGVPTRKIVSNFYDRDTRDDLPKKDRAPRPKPTPPKVEGVNPNPKEVPIPQPPQAK